MMEREAESLSGVSHGQAVFFTVGCRGLSFTARLLQLALVDGFLFQTFLLGR